jgi:hypothetical protein
MRGVDLARFDFDYDLTWMAFFLTPDERILGRFGGRDAESAEKYLTLAGLRHALREALARHREGETPPPLPEVSTRRAEEYPAARRLADRSCIHCHHVYDFRNEERQASGAWRLEDAWVYPLPENLGLTLDPNQGNRVAHVVAGSAAATAGLREGDVLSHLGSRPVASFADVHHVLHSLPARGKIAVAGRRGDGRFRADLELPRSWRQTDLSWRRSTLRLGPPPAIQGEDLSAEERAALGLSPKQLALRHGGFFSVAARQAGIRAGDVIVGLDGKSPEMTVNQFLTHVRLHYRPGDRVTYTVLRAGKRIDIPLTLPARSPF